MEGEWMMDIESVESKVNYIVREESGQLWGYSEIPYKDLGFDDDNVMEWRNDDSDIVIELEEHPFFEPLKFDNSIPWTVDDSFRKYIKELEFIEPVEMEPVPDDEGDMIRNVKHYFGIFDLEVETVLQNFIPKFQDAYIGHRVASAIEYLLRSPEKNGIEDIKKAHRNLEQAIEHYENRGAGIL